MKNKHITIIGLNFFPEDTAIGLYSTQLANYLKEQGAEVSIVTAFPYYPQWKIAEDYQNKPRFLTEDHNGMMLYRYKQYTPSRPTFLKRIFQIIDFTLGSYKNVRKIKKCDYVISVVPFTSSAFLGNLLKKRMDAKHWIHIQDFEFDAAFQSGLVQSNKGGKGFIHTYLMRLEKRIFSKADMVSTISHTMLEKLAGKTTSNTNYLPNWIDASEINPESSKEHPYLKSSKFKILYSGNIGDKQDWNFFGRFIDRLDFERFEIIIVGDGAKRKQLGNDLENYAGVTFYPPVAYEELSNLLCSADAHLLFQKTDVLDAVMPSKILGMMASEKPSVITGHPDSEVAKVLQESDGGFYISDKNLDVLMQHFEEIYEDKSRAKQMGTNARTYVVTNFSRAQILKQFIEQLAKV